MATQVGALPASVDLVTYAGDDFWVNLKVVSSTGTPVDLSPFTPKAQIRAAPRSTAVLGEFGGLGLALPNRTWRKEHWGYRDMKDLKEYALNYEKLFDRLWLLKTDPGLSAAVYTQTTDVETEVNGLMTYDREVLKLDPAKALDIHRDRIVSSPRIVPEGGLFLDSLTVHKETIRP